ncbi:hypothetical protein HZR84_08805 [Hyphobacterium sp. CCMP332]|nr:hypothetical protein HZR84_08805 [Hyphobacterium sp. CCMP332]
MNLIILKSDIDSSDKLVSVKKALSNLSEILDWNVDFMDIDKVLRIECAQVISERAVIDQCKNVGIICEPLPE